MKQLNFIRKDGFTIIQEGLTDPECLAFTKDAVRAAQIAFEAVKAYSGPPINLHSEEPILTGDYFQARVLLDGKPGAVLVNMNLQPTGFRFQGPNVLNPAALPNEIWHVDLNGDLFPYQRSSKPELYRPKSDETES